MTSWLNGKVVENRHWTETLFSLRVEAPKLTFQAGQFVRIALDEVARPFSFVNAPQDPLLEFYGVIVPEGPLSPRLARLRAGDTLRIASNPAGFLVLSEVPDAQTLWLLVAARAVQEPREVLRLELRDHAIPRDVIALVQHGRDERRRRRAILHPRHRCRALVPSLRPLGR